MAEALTASFDLSDSHQVTDGRTTGNLKMKGVAEQRYWRGKKKVAAYVSVSCGEAERWESNHCAAPGGVARLSPSIGPEASPHLSKVSCSLKSNGLLTVLGSQCP